MNFFSSLNRIALFFVSRKRDFLAKDFYLTIFRVIKDRFNFLEMIPNRKFFRTNGYPRFLENIHFLLSHNESLGCPVEIKIAFRTCLSYKETLNLPDYLKISKLPHSVEFNTDFDSRLGTITQENLLDQGLDSASLHNLCRKGTWAFQNRPKLVIP